MITISVPTAIFVNVLLIMFDCSVHSNYTGVYTYLSEYICAFVHPHTVVYVHG